MQGIYTGTVPVRWTVMQGPREFDWKTVPLEGVRLVEAGAGTGKTYVIIRLYLRLLLEAGLTVDRVLVLTFTQAATAELRARVYRTLITLGRILRYPDTAPADAEDRRLLAGVDVAQASKRIDAALACFEQAAIFTIHGLCWRVLSERAFECGLSLGAELDPEAAKWLPQLARDHWRRRVYRAGPLFAELAMQHYKGGPLDLCARPGELAGPETAVPERTTELPGFDVLDDKYTRAFRDAATCWRSERAEIHALITHPGVLKRNVYRPRSLPDWYAELDRLFSIDAPTLELPDKLQKFTPEHLAAATCKGSTVPEHSFFTACGQLYALQSLYHGHLVHLRSSFLKDARAAAAEQSRRSGLLGYDDLLYELCQAVTGSAALRKLLQENFGAVLVDEFQDTDKLQYQILKSIWAGGQPVFLVGDPKQAIYGFRGADVYAYLQARRQIAPDCLHTLTGNRRSVPGLVDACNAMFGKQNHPFLEPEIPFIPAHAIAPPRDVLRLNGAPATPMVLWWYHQPEITVRRLEQLVATAVADQIACLLAPNSGATLAGRPLGGAEIAVLVRRHSQGRLILDALRRVGVGGVLYGASSVFAGRMAEELLRVLCAVAEPDREDRARTALSTLLLGVNAAELLLLDDAGWNRWMRDFRRWQQLWRQRGFMLMFYQLLADCRAVPRLAASTEGERDITDLHHLAELLQAEERRRRQHAPAAALRWLGERIDKAAEGPETPEAERLRLESDAHLVRVATIHRSKGLAYEIVFCPFPWQGGIQAGGERIFSDLAEELRLFYVALTRARQRCYLVWARPNRVSWTAPSWLLHAATNEAPAEALQRAPRLKAIDQKDFVADLERFAARASGSVRLETLPQPSATARRPAIVTTAATQQLKCRRFNGKIPPSFGVTSYSALVRGYGVELPDHDAVAALGSATDGDDIHALPAGARTGQCLHELLECLDFTHGDEDTQALENLCASTLTRHGLCAERWTPAVVDVIGRVLDADLDDGGVRLRGLPACACLRELEFYFRLRGLSARGLLAVLNEHGVFADERGTTPAHLEFAPVQGAVKGFIDLVFEAKGRYYVIDYKSNRLGETQRDYTDERIRAAMVSEGYVLQYLLYTVALHRYLRDCLPNYRYEDHIGGVRYLFLRGVEAGSRRGVFRNLPAPALVRALDTYFDSAEVVVSG